MFFGLFFSFYFFRFLFLFWGAVVFVWGRIPVFVFFLFIKTNQKKLPQLQANLRLLADSDTTPDDVVIADIGHQALDALEDFLLLLFLLICCCSLLLLILLFQAPCLRKHTGEGKDNNPFLQPDFPCHTVHLQMSSTFPSCNTLCLTNSKSFSSLVFCFSFFLLFFFFIFSLF